MTPLDRHGYLPSSSSRQCDSRAVAVDAALNVELGDRGWRTTAVPGLAIDAMRVVGTEWREFAEERTQPASRALLRLSRLRRQRDASWARTVRTSTSTSRPTCTRTPSSSSASSSRLSVCSAAHGRRFGMGRSRWHPSARTAKCVLAVSGGAWGGGVGMFRQGRTCWRCGPTSLIRTRSASR
jgi:hypothetical protein